MKIELSLAAVLFIDGLAAIPTLMGGRDVYQDPKKLLAALHCCPAALKETLLDAERKFTTICA
jgi:hypothetical protein